jgi:hypothetical protein
MNGERRGAAMAAFFGGCWAAEKQAGFFPFAWI